MILTASQEVEKLRGEGKSPEEIIQVLSFRLDNSLDLLQQLMTQQITDVLNNIKL